MGSIPRYELRRDPDAPPGERRWRVWCNTKDKEGKPRGWDNGDGTRTYGDDEFWTAQRRVNGLNGPQGRSPEEEQAKQRAADRAALDKAGRAYLERTRHQLAVRAPQAPPKGEGLHAQEQDVAPRSVAAGDNADGEGAAAGGRAQGTGSGGTAGSVL